MLAIICVSAKLCPPPAYPLSFPRMTWRGNDFLPHVNVRHRADAVQSIQKPHWPGSKVVGKDGSEFNSYSKLSCSHEDLVQGQDRKSTRLNSSHVSISYAVVCILTQ